MFNLSQKSLTPFFHHTLHLLNLFSQSICWQIQFQHSFSHFITDSVGVHHFDNCRFTVITWSSIRSNCPLSFQAYQGTCVTKKLKIFLPMLPEVMTNDCLSAFTKIQNRRLLGWGTHQRAITKECQLSSAHWILLNALVHHSHQKLFLVPVQWYVNMEILLTDLYV